MSSRLPAKNNSLGRYQFAIQRHGCDFAVFSLGSQCVFEVLKDCNVVKQLCDKRCEGLRRFYFVDCPAERFLRSALFMLFCYAIGELRNDQRRLAEFLLLQSGNNLGRQLCIF